MSDIRTRPSCLLEHDASGHQPAASGGALQLMELLTPVWDACTDAVVAIDDRARVTWANAAFRELVGATEHLRSDALLRRLSTADRERVWIALSQTASVGGTAEIRLAGEEPCGAELRYTRFTPSTFVCVLALAEEDSDRVRQLERTLVDIAASLGEIGLGAAQGDPRQLLPNGLTDRQRQVVEMLFHSMSEAEIADALFLSEHTVRNHKKAAFKSLGVHSKAELFSTYRAGRLLVVDNPAGAAPSAEDDCPVGVDHCPILAAGH